MTRQQIIASWNAQADANNQWDSLGEDEKVEWAFDLGQRAFTARVAELEKENADLLHDVREYVRIANAEASEVTELRAALQPFANESIEWKGMDSCYEPLFFQAAADPEYAKFTIGDLRRAAALLAKGR